MRKIVVIGSSSAGMMAAVAAAEQNPECHVTLVTRDELPYRRPAIPALIAGYISGPKEVQILSENTLARYKIQLIAASEAYEIDPATRFISILHCGREEKIPYDAAVIATGSRPLIPRIPGVEKKGVCTFTTHEAALKIVEKAQTAHCAVVVGAGFIALEIAEALMHKDLEVYFNVRSRILRKLVEPDVSEFLMKKFEQQGLRMLTGRAISEIAGEKSVEHVVYKDSKIRTELVIIGTGVEPNVELAKKAGIELGPSGAIQVNHRMETSIEDIYAAGDCAESPDLLTGKFVYSPVGSIGASAGKIAGRNAVGADERTKGFLRAQADQILNMQIFSLGHSSVSADEAGLKIQVRHLEPRQVDGINRFTKPFEMGKLLTDENRKVVGAQLVTKNAGSQFAGQLYRAVVNGEKIDGLLERLHWPRLQMAQTLIQALNSKIVVKNIGDDKTVTVTEDSFRNQMYS
jgi:NADH oxidase (H2O2-forming)